MSGSSATPIASSERALPLYARADLEVTQATYRGESCWIVKDPLSLEYFRLSAEQYALLLLLDGRRSCETIRAQLIEQFPNFRPSLSRLRQLIADLYEKRLVWSMRPGQDEVLAVRARERRIKSCLNAVQNILYIRLPGWDPHRLLKFGYPYVRWLFHPAMVLVTLGLLAFAWVHVLLHFGEFQHRVPPLEQFATWESLAILWITLSLTKILHELGHAMACRHFGGDCHEIGVAFLVFSPCLYCDVSDSWMLPSRRQRIAIAAAGMYIESLLSSAAMFLWWNSQPGMFQHICFAVFLVSNISTILFNLNPLLRLDGYYILSDLLEIPNLRGKADQAFQRFWARWCLGILLPTTGMTSLGFQICLGLFAVCSAIYRWCLAFAICISLYHLLMPYGMSGIGLGLGGLSVLISLSAFGRQVVQIMQRHHDQWSTSRRPIISLVLFASLASAALFLPIPWHVSVPFVVQPHKVEHVYVDSPGRLVAIHVQPGETVEQGDLLLELQDVELIQRMRQLKTALEVQRVEVTVRQAAGDSAQTAVAEESYRALRQELEACQKQQSRLKILAPCDGLIIAPPPQVTPREKDSRRTLSRWEGTPLEMANLGCYLPLRTHLLSVSPTERFDAVLLIEQFHRTDFQLGQSVKLRLATTGSESIESSIASISPATHQRETHTADSITGFSTMKSSGQLGHVTNGYQAVSTLPRLPVKLITGMQGDAKVLVARRTAWQWCWRYLRATFTILL